MPTYGPIFLKQVVRHTIKISLFRIPSISVRMQVADVQKL